MSSAFTESLLSTGADAFLWMPAGLDEQGGDASFVPFYFWLINACRPRLLVASGPSLGLAYAALCEAAARAKLNGRCYAVGAPARNGDSECAEDPIRAFNEFNQRHYARFSKVLSLDESDALKHFDDGTIDLLHLHGFRSQAALRQQFDAWRPKLSNSAVIILERTKLHGDYSDNSPPFGDLEPEFSSFDFTHDSGLRLIIAGSNAPEALKQLCALTDSSEIAAIRERFSALGAQWRNIAEAAHARQQETPSTGTDSTTNHLRAELARGEAVIAHISARYQAMRGRLTGTKLPWLMNWRSKALSSHGVTPQALATIRNSVFFDAEFYLDANPDVRAAGVDPALHYLVHGGFERRNPGPAFSTRQYLEHNPDVFALRMNALLHYELHGREEGRLAPCFDPALTARALHAITGRKRTTSFLRSIGEVLGGGLPLGRKRLGGRSRSDTSYANWIRLYDTLSERDRRQIRSHIERFAYRPLISVVMPAYETPEKILREAIASLQAQLYQNWELCIADDASPSANVMNVLKEMSASDPRIKWMRCETNGHISEASNSALELASGEFVALMDHDDLLAEHALYEVAAELNEYPDADIIYSDEDRIDDQGNRHSPYFKTDWNPELFFGHNLISHLGLYRRSILEAVGHFRKGYEGSQDYDLALRVVAATTSAKIRHIPSVLYHWRSGSTEASFSEDQLQRCIAAARAAKADYFSYCHETIEVSQNPLVPAWERIRRPIPSPAPLVSLIVPTRNRHDLLAPCLDGLLNRTDYPSVEILIIDHQSDDPDTLALLERWRHDKRVRIIRYEGAFNYSDMNNKAVAEANGEIIGLINNDVDVIDPNWLSEMVSHAACSENGAVGAKLLYPNDRIQHAGVILGVGGIAGHLHLNASRQAPGYFGRLALASNVSAITGACLIVRKAVFQEVGGLNAVDLPVAFNDVDLCLKIQAKGYRNVWTPFALLYHHESSSRGYDTTPDKIERAQREGEYMRHQWGHLLDQDPYFNPNLSLRTSAFDLAFPPRRVKPWHRSQKFRHS